MGADDKEWHAQVDKSADALMIAIDSNARIPAYLRDLAVGMVRLAIKVLA